MSKLLTSKFEQTNWARHLFFSSINCTGLIQWFYDVNATVLNICIWGMGLKVSKIWPFLITVNQHFFLVYSQQLMMWNNCIVLKKPSFMKGKKHCFQMFKLMFLANKFTCCCCCLSVCSVKIPFHMSTYKHLYNGIQLFICKLIPQNWANAFQKKKFFFFLL